jgi:hypothetical protein
MDQKRINTEHPVTTNQDVERVVGHGRQGVAGKIPQKSPRRQIPGMHLGCGRNDNIGVRGHRRQRRLLPSKLPRGEGAGAAGSGIPDTSEQ